MEEGVVPLSTILATSADGIMELDYMDQLLLEGCWVEANGSDFLYPISPFEPSFQWPVLEASNGGAASPSKGGIDERQRSCLTENVSMRGPQTTSLVENTCNSSVQCDVYEAGSEVSKRWWIGPTASASVMDRLIQALGYIKERSRDKGVLIQVWVPVTREGKRVLTTSDQPFSLDLNCPRLAHYREISVNYQFPAEEDSIEGVGLPGRVFKSKVPEWTPDVRFFTRDEYPRVRHAQQVDVRGTLAVPILEQGSRNCLGVIEVILTSQKVQYRPELETVCKALEAVDLRSAQVSISQNVKCDLSYQAALPEILEVFRAACATHQLPLAQTWVPCTLQGKGGCRHSEENLENCVSPVDSACYIGDSRIQGFHEACSDYHLMRGQGIVGRAFGTNGPCFSPDVTACSHTEYPLSHHARMFGLRAAVAIRLRSICTGLADFVLELFLPTDCVAPQEHKKMLTSLSTIIHNVCRTLRVVTDKELQEESAASPRATSIISTEAVTGGCIPESGEVVLPFQNGKPREMLAQVRRGEHDMDMSSVSGDGSSRRRLKSEKTITLQVLRQHFAGSLKDAARKLGVCPTTLKRICRQHGVQRWPSRKIKKVGHSLQKIQRVIDSVHGASGVVHIDTFYSNFPQLASPKTIPSNKQQKKESPSPSSSCSQSSNSSQCYSSGAQPSSISFSVAKERSDPTSLKRTRTEANLLNPTTTNLPKLVPRSKSNILLTAAEAEAEASQNSEALRIKVSYGEDNIRFRMRSNWRHKDLLQEISRRFGVEEPSSFHLKYLDDDAEWVLLTCDADLDECIDVCRGNTIKLAFLRNPHAQYHRNFSSIRGPSSSS